MPELFNIAEAAAIAEIDADTIRTALEKKSVTPSHRTRVGKAVRYRFSAGDILFVKVLAEFPFALSKEDKQSLSKVLANGSTQAACWSRHGTELVYQCGEMRLSFAIKAIEQKLERNLNTFRYGQQHVASSPDILAGEPVFRGTRIPLQHIASLFRKDIPEREIREDHPQLSARDLQYARLASRLLDKPGRPRKRLVMQRRAA